jgi:hypothetical protein
MSPALALKLDVAGAPAKIHTTWRDPPSGYCVAHRRRKPCRSCVVARAMRVGAFCILALAAVFALLGPCAGLAYAP